MGCSGQAWAAAALAVSSRVARIFLNGSMASSPSVLCSKVGRLRLQRCGVVAGDALVVVGDGLQLRAADDIVEALEALAPGALEHLAEDGVRRVAAVGQDHARRGLDAHPVVV